MTQSSQVTANGGWLRASGILDIARSLGLAVHPAKLGLALAGLVATLAYGGLLDWIATRGGGVPANAISQFIGSRESVEPYVEGTGNAGIFQVWREHQRRSLLGLLGSPVVSVSPDTAFRDFVETHAARSHMPWYTNLADMGRGTWWMIRVHPFFFVFFAAGALFIWSLAGGAMCRIAAVQFARDEKITVNEALRYVWKRLVGGFMMAPCIPIAFMFFICVLLIAGGLFLRIPVLGDVLGAPLFGFALLGGFLIAVLGVGMLVGGGLFWPAVAVEGSDAFDSFSRSLAYPFSRPWKAVLYYLVTAVYAVICWLIVNLIVHWAVMVTRGVASWGTSPFGWWRRGESGVSKLELLWPLGGTSGLHRWPDWSQLGVFEHFSAFVIGVFVLLAIGLTWAFLFSFCFSADTIIYFLLRRDVDGNDLSEIHQDDPKPGPPAGTIATPNPEPAKGNVSLPIAGNPGTGGG